MTDYTELVKALVCDENCWDNRCKYLESSSYNWCNTKRLRSDAAAAIEALQAEVERLKDSNEELREKQTYIDHYGDKWLTSAKDVPTSAYNHGYMDGKNEAEQALEPKRGEWQKAKPKGVVTYSDGYAECSHCHETIWLGWGMNFCPHCGTQNKIIDPDDYDGAKMNDSNASNALGNAQDGPIITPCRGCSDYDGYGGCKSKGGCARAKTEAQDEA